jgi:hypothetical protein
VIDAVAAAQHTRPVAEVLPFPRRANGGLPPLAS